MRRKIEPKNFATVIIKTICNRRMLSALRSSSLGPLLAELVGVLVPIFEAATAGASVAVGGVSFAPAISINQIPATKTASRAK